MTKSHAPQPLICPACVQLLKDSIRSEPQQTGNLVYCPHRSVIAKVRIEAGVIVGWLCTGPYLPREAIEAIYHAGIGDGGSKVTDVAKIHRTEH